MLGLEGLLVLPFHMCLHFLIAYSRLLLHHREDGEAHIESSNSLEGDRVARRKSLGTRLSNSIGLSMNDQNGI